MAAEPVGNLGTAGWPGQDYFPLEILKLKSLSIIGPRSIRKNIANNFHLLNSVSFRVFPGPRVIIFHRHGSG
jgi:hypothetical protein